MIPEKTDKSLLSMERSTHKWSKSKAVKLCIDCIRNENCMIQGQCMPFKKYWQNGKILKEEFRKARL
jgi:hypothetical protein